MPRLKSRRYFAGFSLKKGPSAPSKPKTLAETLARTCTRQQQLTMRRLSVAPELTWPELVALELMNQEEQERR